MPFVQSSAKRKSKLTNGIRVYSTWAGFPQTLYSEHSISIRTVSYLYKYTGCPSDIVPSGIRIFDMKGLSKNMNSIHLAWRPMLFLGLRAKNFRKNYTLCDFLEATVKNLKSGFSLFHCYCIPPPGCILTKAY